MATAKDIADKLGISAAAVSMALNNKPGIGKKTRTLILETASEMGYRKRVRSESKDSVLQMLVYVNTAETSLYHSNPFFAQITEGISSRAQELGYSLHISYVYENELECGAANLASMVGQNCSGLLVLASYMHESHAELLRQLLLPTVIIDNAFHNEKFNTISIDNYFAISSLIRYLISLGHQDFCFVGNASYMTNMAEREQAFLAVLRDHPEISCTLAGSATASAAAFFSDPVRALQKEIGEMENMPTAFVCVNDWVASVCIRALTLLGYQVPQDVSVSGFDNIPLGEMTSPSITTIDIPKMKIGVLAVNRLVELISGDSEAVKIQVLSDIIVRESTAPPAR